MAQLTSWKGLKIATPAAYRIRVQGYIDRAWIGRFGGMTLTRETAAEKLEITVLEGQMRDQAALSGVLNTLYDLHLPLLNVECIDEPKA
jgi:hypothetical protein